jgi:hypothetical protein
MIKIALLAAGVVALLVVVVLVAGARAPLRHLSRTSVVLRGNPHEIWSIVSDVGAWTSWNANVKAVKRLADRNGNAVWAVESGGRVLPSEILANARSESGGRLVTRIADETLPFGGTWTWEFAPSGSNSSTLVSITEDGVIKNIVFRGVSSLFLGYTRTQETYLTALAARFGEPQPSLERSVSFPP